ncbi:MFS transporter [Cupriavidus sp. TMH.W2]|uniref:MFS transporter n=1 Tax=Cupriavidus sp. TMH.W2 TaxID=3434465 RepID=UPI003D777530
MRFVLLVGVLSFFADFTYEGARSVTGPYLASLGVGAAVLGVVVGFGELLGYGLRVVSGRFADATGLLWPTTIAGYLIQMLAVPLLALTHDWRSAACLIVLERVGKAIRNPPRDVMLSHAGEQLGGYGWAFGIHEALDQFGAMFGPLVVAVVLATRNDYRLAFAVLAIPAAINLMCVMLARLTYPKPEDLAPPHDVNGSLTALPPAFWLYLGAAGLVAAGFADYPLIAFHFASSGLLSAHWVPLLYVIAMASSGGASLLFGRLFDRYGFRVIVWLAAFTWLYAPLVWFGGFGSAVLGAVIWGIGMGVHESVIPAAVAPLVDRRRRASAFGLFTAGYGICWFLGSAIIGWAYEQHVGWAVGFCVVTQVIAIPAFVAAGRHMRQPPAATFPGDVH